MPNAPNQSSRKRSYYYRSVRRGKKVHRVYIGPATDPATAVVRRIDRSLQARRRLNRIAENAVDTDFETLLAAYDTRFVLIVLLCQELHMTTPPASDTDPSDSSHRSAAAAKDDFLAVVERAEKGNSEAKAQLKALLDGNPDLYRLLGDVGAHVERHLLDRAAGTSELLRQTIQLNVGELRTKLTSNPDDLLERLLVDRLVTAQLEVALRQIEVLETTSARPLKRAQTALNHAQRRLTECIAEISRLRSAES